MENTEDEITIRTVIEAFCAWGHGVDESEVWGRLCFDENHGRDLYDPVVWVMSDTSELIRLIVWGLTALTGEPHDERAADRALFCDELGVEVYDPGDTAICCECHSTVIRIDPYSGLPAGTVFRDGEGYVCCDCNTANPEGALEDEAEHSYPFGTSPPAYLDFENPPEGWVLAWVTDGVMRKLGGKLSGGERGSPRLVAWRVPSWAPDSIRINLIAFKRASARR